MTVKQLEIIDQQQENLPKIRKANIIDYKFSDYNWDNLNEIDRQLIALEMQNSNQKETGP